MDQIIRKELDQDNYGRREREIRDFVLEFVEEHKENIIKKIAEISKRYGFSTSPNDLNHVIREYFSEPFTVLISKQERP